MPVMSENLLLDDAIFTSFLFASDSWIIALKELDKSCRLHRIAFNDSEL